MPVNYDRLVNDPDPAYRVSVWALVDEVDEARAELHAQQEIEARLQARL